MFQIPNRQNKYIAQRVCGNTGNLPCVYAAINGYPNGTILGNFNEIYGATESETTLIFSPTLFLRHNLYISTCCSGTAGNSDGGGGSSGSYLYCTLYPKVISNSITYYLQSVSMFFANECNNIAISYSNNSQGTVANSQVVLTVANSNAFINGQYGPLIDISSPDDSTGFGSFGTSNVIALGEVGGASGYIGTSNTYTSSGAGYGYSYSASAPPTPTSTKMSLTSKITSTGGASCQPGSGGGSGGGGFNTDYCTQPSPAGGFCQVIVSQSPP